jgi:hypothetical protein
MAYKYICSAITTSGKRCKKRNCIIEDDILVSEYCTIHHKMYYMKDNCSICYNEIVNEKKLKNCNHSFCELCVSQWLIKNPTCPMCRTDVSQKEIEDSIVKCVTNNKIILLNVFDIDLRNIFTEDQYNDFFETESLILIPNKLLSGSDMEYIKSILDPELYNIIINNMQMSYHIMDCETLDIDQDEVYYNFIK